MATIFDWLNKGLTFAHEVMVQHFVKVQDNPATGMRDCAEAIRAAAQISAFGKAKVCAERGGVPDAIGLATEEVIALSALPHWDTTPTEDIYERHYLAAWAAILAAQRNGDF
jgi:hypothetical protein